ncbi:MAG TPA: hypothetical protein VGJ01_08185 [Pseudolabrys sp.]|jgi:hypothetical protein
MRHVLTAAAAVAVCGVLATASARAESTHYSGGPLQDGKQCWVSTNNDLGYGYWHNCPTQPVAHIVHKMKKK